MKYVVIRKKPVDKFLHSSVVYGDTKRDVSVLTGVCIDNIYRYDLIKNVSNYWFSKKGVVINIFVNGDLVSVDNTFLTKYVEFRDYVDGYRMR